MKKIALLYILFYSGYIHKVYSQQEYHFNQYLFNDLILNPAVAGTGPCKVIGIDLRKQWVGFAGSPSTQNIYFHGAFTKKLGLGAIIFNDVAGAVKITGAEVDYSYHAIKNRNHLLTFGLGTTMFNYSINQSEFQPEKTNDPVLSTVSPSKTTFDIAAGTYYRNKYFLVSFGAKQLLQTRLDVSNTGNTKLIRHYFFNASYNVIINQKVRYEPSLFIRSIGKPIPQIDFSFKFIFNDDYWLGVAYRMRDALVIFAGTELGQFTIGYGYEYPVSLLNPFTAGSHEIFLRFSFCKRNKNKDNLFKAEEVKRGYKSVFCPIW